MQSPNTAAASDLISPKRAMSQWVVGQTEPIEKYCQLMNQSINQPINRMINQSISRSNECSCVWLCDI